MRATVALALLLSACGGEIDFPEPYVGKDVTAWIIGSSGGDLWWPDCEGGRWSPWHSSGGGWSRVSGLALDCNSPYLSSAGEDAVWVAQGAQLAKVTSSGQVEDLSKAAGIDGLVYTAAEGRDGHLFVLAQTASERLMLHFVDGVFKERLPAPPQPANWLTVSAPDVVWADQPADGEQPSWANGWRRPSVLARFDGERWHRSSGPAIGWINPGFPANDIWAPDGALEGGGLAVTHFDGRSWREGSVPFPGFDPDETGEGGKPVASRFALSDFGRGSDGALVAVGFIPGEESGSDGFYAAYRWSGDGWSGPENIATSYQGPCDGSCYSQASVRGVLADGTFVFTRTDLVEDGGSIFTFKP